MIFPQCNSVIISATKLSSVFVIIRLMWSDITRHKLIPLSSIHCILRRSHLIPEATGRTLGKGGNGQYETNVAFSVPLFSYTMPGYREYPSSSDLVAQAAIALGSLGLLATVAYIPFYIGLDGSTVVGRSGGPLETMAGLADSWSRAFGMEECGQVSISPTSCNDDIPQI